jgi:hypothetical protein
MLRWILGGGVLVVVAIVGFVAWRMMAPPPDDLDLAPEPVAGVSQISPVVFTDRGRQALIAFLKTLDPVE